MWFLLHLFCRHDLFTLQKFCACVDDTFFIPNKPHGNRWRDSEKWWSEVLHEERFICILISRFISLIFLSTSVALNIFSLYQLFRDFRKFVSLFGGFRFWAPTLKTLKILPAAYFSISFIICVSIMFLCVLNIVDLYFLFYVCISQLILLFFHVFMR